ncbi:MAG: UPF0755 protein [Parcubacteria group bacterium Athens0714_26]|nr:MAG: UPF0755 protein [Parcubacteria group bacterium Athens1014_26]TSD02859.1 MAG: UPF0755 protein [Parcubacteria group bacterium Athens0714_26]
MWSIIAVATIVASGLAVGYFLFALGSASASSLEKNIEIRKGDSFSQIALRLKDAGLVKSEGAFKIYSILSGSAHLFKPGMYGLNAASSTSEIVNELIDGSGTEVEILIPEGLSLRDIDYKLSSQGILPRGVLESFDINKIKNDYEFLSFDGATDGKNQLEGYLFPDTYRFFKNSEPETVVRKFLDNFKEKIWPLVKDKKAVAAKTGLTAKELLIVASIIEREVPDVPASSDRFVIAGILYKRLRLGMPLQVDATVSYAKCSGLLLSCDKPIISKKDLSLQSPYNTYLYNGLPPTPIASPGVDAVKAALVPKNSDFMYYLSDPKTQKTIFAKTLDEHNQNRVKYLNI